MYFTSWKSEDAGQFSPRSGPITGVLFGCQLSKLIVAADTLKLNNRKCFFVENEFLKCPPALSREIDSSQPRSQQTPALGSWEHNNNNYFVQFVDFKMANMKDKTSSQSTYIHILMILPWFRSANLHLCKALLLLALKVNLLNWLNIAIIKKYLIS